MRRFPPSSHLIALIVAAHVALVAVAALGPRPDFRDPSTAVGYYGKYCGVVQRWFMFGSVGPGTTRIEIAIRVEDRWRDVYLERSRTANWNAREFDHYRFREFMNHLRLPRTKSPWRRFVPWVAPLVFDDFPEADAVRVRAMRTTIPAPHILKRDGGLRFRKEVRSRIVLRGPEGPPR